MSIFSRLFQKDSEGPGTPGESGAAPAPGEETGTPTDEGATAQVEPDPATSASSTASTATDMPAIQPETYVAPTSEETSPMVIDVVTPPPVALSRGAEASAGPTGASSGDDDAVSVAAAGAEEDPEPEPDEDAVTAPGSQSQAALVARAVADSAQARGEPADEPFPPFAAPPATSASGSHAIPPPPPPDALFGNSISGEIGAIPTAPRRKATLPPAPASRRGGPTVRRATTPFTAHGRQLGSNGTDLESALDEITPPRPARSASHPPPLPAGSHAAPPPPPRVATTGPTSAADRAAVRATFEELAVGHVMPVRNLMIELRWGEPPAGWLELARPPLRSLKAMTDQMEMRELGTAVSDFLAAIDLAAERAGAFLSGETRQMLLDAYEPLAKAMPQAFDTEGERDRREPVIVQALLRQVRAVEPLIAEKLHAAGLGRLETLLKANADDLAAVTGVPRSVAEALAHRIAEFKKSVPSALTAPDTGEVRRSLAALMPVLEVQHQAFERASMGWTPDHQSAKQRLRRDRQVTYQQVKVLLARLGDLDFVARLEPLAFGRKIDELNRYLRHAIQASASSPVQAGTIGGGESGHPHPPPLPIPS
jgi:hypothetical protein